MPIAKELYERIVAPKVFIDENYHEPIRLEEISQNAFLSRFHFHRLFKRTTGLTPKAYANAHRTQRVQHELAKCAWM